jgi:lipopolysaccharide export LptBFGC system permease protein LptF
MSELEEKANGKTNFGKIKYKKFVEHLKNYIEDEETRNKFLLEFMKIIDFDPNKPPRTKEQEAIKLQKQKEARALAKEKKELEKQEKRLKQNRFKKPIED